MKWLSGKALKTGKITMQRDDQIIQLHPDDPIAIAVQDIAPGSSLRAPDGGRLVAAERIPAGHKIALRDLAPGETILRYGCRIGQASRPIVAGSWVHTHNLEVGAIGAATPAASCRRSSRLPAGAPSSAICGRTVGSGRATTWR